MESTQHMTVQADESLSKRLLRAYKRVSPNLRALARRDFCEQFQVTDDTFRSKRTAQEGYVVTEGECTWMEAYKPSIVRS